MALRKSRVTLQGLSNQSEVIKSSSKKWFGNKSDVFEAKKSTVQNLDKKQTAKNNNLSKKLQLTSSQSVTALSKYQVPNLNSTCTNYSQIHLIPQTVVSSKQSQSLSKFKILQDTKQIQNYKKILFPKGRNTQSNQNIDVKFNFMQTISDKEKDLVNKIRSKYKYNANVRKIIKAWGFQSKGCISEERFQEMINKHFDKSFTKTQCEDLMSCFSNHSRNIDLLSFIKLVFDQEPFTKPNVQVLRQSNNGNRNEGQQLSPQKTLVNKIRDLNEGSLHKCLNKKQQQFRLPALTTNNLKSQAKKLSQKTFLASGQNQLNQTTQPSIYQTLTSTSSPKFNYFTTKAHGVDFNPLQMTDVNQQKTRFGATPPIPLNDQTLAQHKRQKIMDQKYKIIDDLANQRIQQKQRYQNKLQKIRQNQRNQKENIAEIDRRFIERDHANMKKTREENIAYNYVNFIHNDWK